MNFCLRAGKHGGWLGNVHFDIGRSVYVRMHDGMHVCMYALRSVNSEMSSTYETAHTIFTFRSAHARPQPSALTMPATVRVLAQPSREARWRGRLAASALAAGSQQQAGRQQQAARRGGSRGQEGTHASAGPSAGAPSRHTLWSSVFLLRLAPSLPGPHGVSHHSRWLLRYMGEVTGGPARVTAQRRPHQSRREAGRVIVASGTAARTCELRVRLGCRVTRFGRFAPPATLAVRKKFQVPRRRLNGFWQVASGRASPGVRAARWRTLRN